MIDLKKATDEMSVAFFIFTYTVQSESSFPCFMIFPIITDINFFLDPTTYCVYNPF